MDRLTEEDRLRLQVADLRLALCQRERDGIVVTLSRAYGLGPQDNINIDTGAITRADGPAHDDLPRTEAERGIRPIGQ